MCTCGARTANNSVRYFSTGAGRKTHTKKKNTYFFFLSEIREISIITFSFSLLASVQQERAKDYKSKPSNTTFTFKPHIPQLRLPEGDPLPILVLLLVVEARTGRLTEVGVALLAHVDVEAAYFCVYI